MKSNGGQALNQPDMSGVIFLPNPLGFITRVHLGQSLEKVFKNGTVLLRKSQLGKLPVCHHSDSGPVPNWPLSPPAVGNLHGVTGETTHTCSSIPLLRPVFVLDKIAKCVASEDDAKQNMPLAQRSL